jgi:DNA-binding LacI/PurR family transcriptional regulator
MCKFPFVVIGRPEVVKDLLWVDNDNFQAMYQLTQTLIDKGHRSIGFIGAKENLNVSKDRLNGFKQGLFSRNIEVNEDLIIQTGEFFEEDGYNAAVEIINKNKVTAIVATDDLLAFGVQKLLREKKINDIAVVGFNNIPLAKYQEPPLASVDVNGEKLGYFATKLLIDKLEGREINKKFCIIETVFIERDSVFNIKL